LNEDEQSKDGDPDDWAVELAEEDTLKNTSPLEEHDTTEATTEAQPEDSAATATHVADIAETGTETETGTAGTETTIDPTGTAIEVSIAVEGTEVDSTTAAVVVVVEEEEQETEAEDLVVVLEGEVSAAVVTEEDGTEGLDTVEVGSVVMLIPQAAPQQTSLSMHRPVRLVVGLDTKTDTAAVRTMFLSVVVVVVVVLLLQQLRLDLLQLRQEDKTTLNNIAVDTKTDIGTTTEIIEAMGVEKGVIGMEHAAVIAANTRMVERDGRKMTAVRNDESIEIAQTLKKIFGRVR